MDIENRLKQVFSDILGISIGEIHNDLSPLTNEVWDSLQHVTLMSAIGEEFLISIEPEVAIEMFSFEKALAGVRSLVEEQK